MTREGLTYEQLLARCQQLEAEIERLRAKLDDAVAKLIRAGVPPWQEEWDALHAEIKRLRAEPPHALSFAGQERQRRSRENVAELQAEIERLRELGTDLVDAIIDPDISTDDQQEAVRAWHAFLWAVAGGKPSDADDPSSRQIAEMEC